MKDEFVSGFLVPEDIIEIIPNPVDIRSIRTFALPIKRFDRGGVCYIAAGRLTFQKGFDRLLYWFSKLEDKRATLTILGDGKLKDGLMKQSKLLNLQGRVKFLGFCNNPWQWYAGADIFLLSSRWEGMPNSVLEALTCGTPVIATADSGGIIELKQQTYPGAIVIVGKDEEFIEAMRKITLQKGILLRDSLLPDFYQLDSVLQKVEKLLK
jgi:glycosyltransferase involved in cell wall biosynthesis